MSDTYLIYGSLALLGVLAAMLLLSLDWFWDCWDDCSKDEAKELEKYRSKDESN